MGIKDKFLSTARNAVSKARDTFDDFKGRYDPRTRDYGLESVEPVYGTGPSAVDVLPESDIDTTDRVTDGTDVPEEVRTDVDMVVPDAPAIVVSADETPSDDGDTVAEDVPEPGVIAIARVPPEELPPTVSALPLRRRASLVWRNMYASSKVIHKKECPVGLSFVGLVALLFASLYLMKLLSSLHSFQDDMSVIKRVFSGGLMLFVFYQYINYVITIFRLKSGMRGSWAAMMRLSGSYVALMLLGAIGILDWLPFDLVAYSSWLLSLFMVAVMVFMMLPNVRDFYKPPYEDDVPLSAWLRFVFGKDPYGSIEDELDVDSYIHIDQ